MSITVSKTRDVLVDVARQLFARMGVDHTTMNDIAQASQKGRRTIYTYFNSKDDIYEAVIESELDKLIEISAEIMAKTLPADEKLITFIYTRLNAVKTIVFRNGTLRASFFRDIWRVEKVRKKFDYQEIVIIKNILHDGVTEGLFEMPDVNQTAMVIHHALKGLEVPYIRGLMADSDDERAELKANVMNLIFNGIKIKNRENVY
jgi:AcrR family transcriptional regulator